ncbi:MAG TPA: PAS domain-containing protein [Firmicutes bacterium]|jgi:PAS domain-containing protein|nr:PAS domain-containing protein [Bacillota bacterium]
MWHLVFDLRINLLPVVVLNAMVLIGYSLLRAKKNTLLYLYISLHCLISIWSVGQIMEVLSIDRQSMWFAVKFKYFGICFIGLNWLLLCGIYTRHKLFSLKKIIYFLSLPPFLSYLTLLTNERHFVFFSVFDYGYTAYGIMFWFHTGFSYLYLLTGIIMLITKAIKEWGKASVRPLLLIIAALVPLAANLIIIANLIFDLYIFNRADITPICFSASLFLFSLATFRYQFLNIVPIALRKIMDNMREAIVIIDSFGKIIDFNPAFQNAFPAYARAPDNEIKSFVDFLRQNSEGASEARAIIEAVATGTSAYIDGELCLLEPGKTHYFVYVQPIYYGKEKSIHGTVVLFNDITNYKNLLEELKDKNEEISAMNEELVAMNKQLRDHARVLELITVLAWA